MPSHHKKNLVYRALLSILLAALLPQAIAQPAAEQTCQPRTEQDPTLNNLVHPPGYVPGAAGDLGDVLRAGDGPVDMVLIAGAGFGSDVFASFMEANASRYRMFAVTLPGFAGTAAPPMPAEKTSYGELTWTRGAKEAVARLIEEERLVRPVVVGHWLGATPVVVGLALERPDLVRGAVLISGVPKFVPSGSGMAEPASIAQRVAMVDHYLAPEWFRTVTRATWNDNNFLPRDYAIHPLRAQQLWMEAARPSLPIWIRYLCESWAQDSTARLAELQIPLLVLKPGLDDLYHLGPQTGDYLHALAHRGWEGVEQLSDQIQVETIPESRVFIMDDQPAKLDEALSRFVHGPAARAAEVAVKRPVPAEKAPLQDGRGFWGGSVRQDGNRFTLTDAGVAVERPTASWNVEAVVEEPPVLARLRDPSGQSEVTVQVRPTMGMDLAALVPMVESGFAQQLTDYEHIRTDKDKLAGRPAYRMEFRYVRDGEGVQTILLVTALDETQMISLSINAAPEKFDSFREAFDGIGKSLALLKVGG